MQIDFRCLDYLFYLSGRLIVNMLKDFGFNKRDMVVN